MIYVKSFLAGLLAMFVGMGAVLFAEIGWALISLSRSNEAGAIGFDPVSLLRWPSGWIVGLLAFLGGFYWQHRRLATP
jgi:hypothetical protein